MLVLNLERFGKLVYDKEVCVFAHRVIHGKNHLVCRVKRISVFRLFDEVLYESFDCLLKGKKFALFHQPVLFQLHYKRVKLQVFNRLFVFFSHLLRGKLLVYHRLNIFCRAVIPRRYEFIRRHRPFGYAHKRVVHLRRDSLSAVAVGSHLVKPVKLIVLLGRHIRAGAPAFSLCFRTGERCQLSLLRFDILQKVAFGQILAENTPHIGFAVRKCGGLSAAVISVAFQQCAYVDFPFLLAVFKIGRRNKREARNIKRYAGKIKGKACAVHFFELVKASLLAVDAKRTHARKVSGTSSAIILTEHCTAAGTFIFSNVRHPASLLMMDFVLNKIRGKSCELLFTATLYHNFSQKVAFLKSHTLVILHNLQFVHIFSAISAKSDGECAFHPQFVSVPLQNIFRLFPHIISRIIFSSGDGFTALLPVSGGGGGVALLARVSRVPG